MQTIYDYQRGQQFLPTIELIEDNTQPPKPITEPELITLMHKHKIAIDAYHDTHIHALKSKCKFKNSFTKNPYS